MVSRETDFRDSKVPSEMGSRSEWAAVNPNNRWMYAQQCLNVMNRACRSVFRGGIIEVKIKILSTAPIARPLIAPPLAQLIIVHSPSSLIPHSSLCAESPESTPDTCSESPKGRF